MAITDVASNLRAGMEARSYTYYIIIKSSFCENILGNIIDLSIFLWYNYVICLSYILMIGNGIKEPA